MNLPGRVEYGDALTENAEPHLSQFPNLESEYFPDITSS
jgi:hypothetical protein